MHAAARLLAAVAAATTTTALAPKWPVTWSLSSSSIIQPCNYSGFVEPLSFYAQFGVVDFDWSSAKAIWVKGNATNGGMNDEELLVEQCSMLKALNPNLRCFVYRNLVKVR